jgi:hypothetical protein
MPKDSKAHVFLSHSSKDKPFVRKLTEALKGHNLNVWLDEKELQVGDSIVGGVSQGLESADYLVVVLSKASVGSRWLQAELNAALMEELSAREVRSCRCLSKTANCPRCLKTVFTRISATTSMPACKSCWRYLSKKENPLLMSPQKLQAARPPVLRNWRLSHWLTTGGGS